MLFQTLLFHALLMFEESVFQNGILTVIGRQGQVDEQILYIIAVVVVVLLVYLRRSMLILERDGRICVSVADKLFG